MIDLAIFALNTFHWASAAAAVWWTGENVTRFWLASSRR